MFRYARLHRKSSPCFWSQHFLYCDYFLSVVSKFTFEFFRLNLQFTCFLYLQLRLARLSKPIVCLTIISTLVVPSYRWNHVPERGRDVPGFENKNFHGSSFLPSEFSSLYFLSSDYLLKNGF